MIRHLLSSSALLLRRVAPLFMMGAACALLFAVPQAIAADADPIDTRQEPSLEGAYSDWSLYAMQENGNLVCYLSSGLERSSETVPRRRPPHILITNRPAEGKKGVVSVDAGYVYDDGSSVLMSIGRKQFHLFTNGGTAWAEDSDDLPIIAAIRAGSALVVTGRMKNGPATTDTFSLKGFGQALAALDHACPIAGPEPAHIRHRKRKKPR